jgi:hypothetical protein
MASYYGAARAEIIWKKLTSPCMHMRNCFFTQRNI